MHVESVESESDSEEIQDTNQEESTSKAKRKQFERDTDPDRSTSSKKRKPIEDINFDERCVCFRTYQDDIVEQTGLEWVQCACTRWLHEECIDYSVTVNEHGEELLCPFC